MLAVSFGIPGRGESFCRKVIGCLSVTDSPSGPAPLCCGEARRFLLFTRCLRDFSGARETAQMAMIAFSAALALLLWISHTASSARVYPPNEGMNQKTEGILIMLFLLRSDCCCQYGLCFPGSSCAQRRLNAESSVFLYNDYAYLATVRSQGAPTQVCSLDRFIYLLTVLIPRSLRIFFFIAVPKSFKLLCILGALNELALPL